MRYYIGVDVGAAVIKSGVVNAKGELFHFAEQVVDSRHDSQLIQDDIAKIVRTLRATPEGHKAKMVGVAVGALIQFEEGLIIEAPNIPFRNFPFRNAIEKMVNLPVVLDNDANMELLGEQWKGAAQDEKNVVLLSMSTGIGGAVIIDKKLFRGPHGAAAEFGHMIVSESEATCSAGHRGCLESVIGGKVIARRGIEEIGGTGDSAQKIADLALAGNTKAKAIVREMGAITARPVATLMHIFNPSKIIIRGYISRAWDDFYAGLMDALPHYAFLSVREMTTIIPSELQNRAGVIGAARACMANTWLSVR